MKQWHKLVLALAVLGTCVLVGGVAFAATSRSHSKAPSVKRTPAAGKHYAKARSIQVQKAKPAHAKATPRSSGQDTEEQPQSESESSSDTEQGQPGEPAQGHEDPPGDVNHECTGDCQE